MECGVCVKTYQGIGDPSGATIRKLEAPQLTFFAYRLLVNVRYGRAEVQQWRPIVFEERKGGRGGGKVEFALRLATVGVVHPCWCLEWERGALTLDVVQSTGLQRMCRVYRT